MRVDFFRYFLFHDPNWDYRTLDMERDLAYAEQKLRFMSAVERDLSPYKKSGGKLLMYTGWADPVVPPHDTVAYYDSVVKTMGGLEKTREFFRFFLAPGMGHCSGGPGPNQFDMLGALEQWVEKGVAPDRVIASRSTNGKVDRTRPLCLYPLVARHKGTGSTDEAANFSCVAAPPTGAAGEKHDRAAAVSYDRRDFLKTTVAAGAGALTAATAHGQPPAGNLFPGFETRKIQTSGATINVLRGGSGPPLLLIHGYPQTHAEWHKIAPRLAERFTVVMTDLRGYGDSSKPPDGENHAGYSKRAMALDQVEVMRALGFPRFAVVGHDRGARVTWRLAVEHPDA